RARSAAGNGSVVGATVQGEVQRSQTRASNNDDVGRERCAPRETRSGPARRGGDGVAQVTVATGFDVDYYLDQVGVDYYLTAAGEPPGIWAGKGAAALGLRGLVGADEASKETMRALFHYGIGPDGVPLSTRQRAPKYQARAAYAQVEEAIAKRVAAL